MRKVLGFAVYILIVLFVFSGCGSNDNILATVNGQKILKDELDSRLKQVAIMYDYDLENPDNKSMVSYLEEQVLQSLIEEKLIRQDAAKNKIEVSKEEMDNEIKNIRDQFESEETYKEFLKERMFTEDDLEMFIENQLTLNKVFEEVTKDITTPAEDPRQYYEENKETFDQAEQVKAQHILVMTEEEAKDIITRLEKGEDFGKLALEVSIDPTVKDNEGVINYFTMEDMIVEEFKKAAFSLKAGEYTKTPVQTTYGFHVIKSLDKTEAKQYEYEEIKDELTSRLLMEEKNQKFTEYMDKLRNEADIKNNLAKEENKEDASAPAETGDGAAQSDK